MVSQFSCPSFLHQGLFALMLALLAPIPVDTIADGYCTHTEGCSWGCCGAVNSTGIGVCGTGPDYCGDGCISQCDYQTDCDPGWGLEWSKRSTCPLNVCCSKYGYCGTTPEFCGSTTVTSPSCDVSADSSNGRTIGYYEGWNWQRSCGTMAPEDIPLNYYTHINFAFSLIDPTTFRLAPMDETTETLYSRVTKLKARDPDLKVWLAIGGWAMNDPDTTRTTFSDLAGSESSQAAFFESLASFLTTNNFDGVDIDWEYPVAEERGGIDADFGNFVTFLSNIRNRLNEMGQDIGLSITLPASYWYLKGFDIVSLEQYVDWFNVMAYDIHGAWDSNVITIGSHAYAHTNLTEINSAMELLWRNNINPSRVNLGLGFYGRSFTMASSDCLTAGCPIEGGTGGHPGECTGTAGVLSMYEIFNLIATEDVNVTLDEAAAVKIATWDSTQWVSYDDTETLKMKVNYANERCLGGTMVWAVDFDNGTLINDLGSSLNRSKIKIPELPLAENCFGASGCAFQNTNITWA